MKLLKKQIFGMPLGIAIFAAWLIVQSFGSGGTGTVNILFGMISSSDSMELWNGFYKILTPIIIVSIALSSRESFGYKKQSYMLALFFMTVLIFESLMSFSAVMFTDSLFMAIFKDSQKALGKQDISPETLQNIFNAMMFLRLTMLTFITYCLYVNKPFFNKFTPKEKV